MTAPILSTGIFTTVTRGAYGLISSGPSMASAITSRMCSRASRACVSAAASTSDGMPSSLVSSCSAVTNSLVPATLKSMSPKASSAPRMSVSATYSVLPSTVSDTRPIAMPATGAFSGTPALSSAERRGADRAHRGRAVGAERLGDLPDRVRELVAARQHRHERPLGQRAVADLAALGRTDPAGLTGRVRREVVVVHVALGAVRAQRVELLLQAEHVQRGDAQDLGLAALEQRRAVHPRHDLDLGRERADVR